MTWSKKCVLTDLLTTSSDDIVNPPVVAINATTRATFAVTDCKLYVPVVTLSADNDNNLLDKLKTVFKRTIKWNKYRSEMSNHTKNNNLNYLIDPAFTKVNILFVLTFKNEEDRTFSSKYYVPNLEVTDFNVLINGKSIIWHTYKKRKRSI